MTLFCSAELVYRASNGIQESGDVTWFGRKDFRFALTAYTKSGINRVSAPQLFDFAAINQSELIAWKTFLGSLRVLEPTLFDSGGVSSADRCCVFVCIMHVCSAWRCNPDLSGVWSCWRSRLCVEPSSTSRAAARAARFGASHAAVGRRVAATKRHARHANPVAIRSVIHHALAELFWFPTSHARVGWCGDRAATATRCGSEQPSVDGSFPWEWCR